MIEETHTRTGVDDTLAWRIFRSDASDLTELRRDLRHLPEDGILLVEVITEADIQALKDTGVICTYSIFDLGWMVLGTLQRERAKRQHAGYRIVGSPAT